MSIHKYDIIIEYKETDNQEIQDKNNNIQINVKKLI